MSRGRNDRAFDARIRLGYRRHERIELIAAALGVTRNAVIGRAYRMGLSAPGNNVAALKSPETRAIISQRARERWSDPDFRSRTIAAIRAGIARGRQRRSAA